MTNDDVAHLRNVNGSIARHLARGGPKDDVEHSPWR